MHDLTQAAIEAMAAEFPQTAKATIYLSDGRIIEIQDGDKSYLLSNGYSYSGQVLSGQQFGPGAVCASSVTLILNNIDHNFDGLDFQGAEFVPYIGQMFQDGAKEWVQGTRYTIINPVDSNGEIITLTGYDNIILTQKDYDNSLQFPATLAEIAAYCCGQCGLVLATPSFNFSAFEVARQPNINDITYQQMLSYVAQIACCFVVVNRRGEVEFRWFGEEPVHEINTAFSSSAHFNDVYITGCKVKAIGTESDYGETWLIGSDGYVIEVGDNPLVTEGAARTVAENLAARLNGLKFRPVTLQTMPDLRYEIGDRFTVSRDLIRNGPCVGFITNLSYTINDMMTVKCTAETAARANLKTYSQNTATEIRNQIKIDQAAGKIGNYELNVQKMNQLAANTLGFYYSQETLDDGSIIAYWHNRPNRSESTTVYKQGADGFFLSKDGGNTWTNGFDSQGNAVVNIISAIGVNAQWLDIDSVIERINSDGKNSIDSAKVTIDGQSLSSRFMTVDNTIDEFTRTVTSLIKQTADGLKVEIGGANEYTVEVDGKLQKFLEEFATYFEFGTDGLRVAEKDSPFATIYGNSRISFTQDGKEVAYIQYNKLFITDVEILGRMTYRNPEGSYTASVWLDNKNMLVIQ